MNEWQQHFNGGGDVSYSAVGSGKGITDIEARTVDFGASDAPMNSAQSKACLNGGGQCVQVAWGLSATGVGFHVNGLRKLYLNGSVLAGIYLGHITKWNNAAIRKLNKGVHLPSLPITVVYRSDGSGDTYAFTNYLSHVSGTWANNEGYSTAVSFPTGVGANGNTGVTNTVAHTNGAIGYIAVSYLIASNLPAVAVINAAGKPEFPNLPNIIAAGKTGHPGANNAISIVDPPASARSAYPISTFTYAIVPKNAPQKSLLKSFLNYAIGPGQAFDEHLDFAPLPGNIVSADRRAINSL